MCDVNRAQWSPFVSSVRSLQCTVQSASKRRACMQPSSGMIRGRVNQDRKYSYFIKKYIPERHPKLMTSLVRTRFDVFLCTNSKFWVQHFFLLLTTTCVIQPNFSVWNHGKELDVHRERFMRLQKEKKRVTLGESPWYDLRGWLGVKQQLSIYLSTLGESALDILVDLKAVSPTYAPTFATINRWETHFSGERELVFKVIIRILKTNINLLL